MLSGPVMAQDPAEELKDADRAFAAHAKEHGPRAAFLEYMAEDGLIFRTTREPIGRAAFAKEAIGPKGEGTLAWAPEHATVSDDGTLGYTWGFYVYTPPGEDGAKQEARGKYVSVWQRQKDGAWKFIADIGTVDTPAKPSGSANQDG